MLAVRSMGRGGSTGFVDPPEKSPHALLINSSMPPTSMASAAFVFRSARRVLRMATSL